MVIMSTKCFICSSQFDDNDFRLQFDYRHFEPRTVFGPKTVRHYQAGVELSGHFDISTEMSRL